MADPETTTTTTTTAPAGGDGDGGGNRQNERVSTLRAELAAERVAKADVQRQLDTTKGEFEAFKATAVADSTKLLEAEKVKTTKAQQRIIDAELRSLASTMGLQDPDLLLHPLLERSGIKIDDEFNVTGAKEAFEKLKEKKPEWFKPAASTTTTAGGNGGAAGVTTTTTTTTTGAASPSSGGTGGSVDVRKMTKEQYRDWKADQLKALRRGQQAH